MGDGPPIDRRNIEQSPDSRDAADGRHIALWNSIPKSPLSNDTGGA